VMGLAKMAPDGWAYYAAEIAAGGEDYFAGHGDEAGRWVGRGAAALGLGGQVAPEALARLFGEGRHPGTGGYLGHRLPKGGPVPVAGYAISFSPPKSASVLWALADETIAAAVREGHDAAVEAALGFLQDHAGFTRRGKGGAVQADTDGYVAAAFTHRTSRAGDPQLHTHVLIANKVRACSDGRWLSLDGRELFEVQKAAGLVYKASLRSELTARLGVAWAAVDADGGGEIVGVPETVIAGFSTRRAQVLARGDVLAAARETALGRSLSGAERAEVLQLAAYQSRAPKDGRTFSTAELRARWREQAAGFAGAPNGWLGAVLTAQARPAPSAPRPGRRRARTAGLAREVLAGLEESRSTWGRSDVVEALAVRILPGALGDAAKVAAVVDAVTDAILADPDVVRLGADPATAPAVLCRRDGMAPAERHGAARYTTGRVLAAEQAILELTEQGRTAGVAVAAADIVTRAAADAGLGVDQGAAVARLCRGGERVAVMVGPAGAGKSRSLAAARAAWQAAGVAVRGVAPSAVAAGVLAEQASISADTLAKFLLDAEAGRTRLLPGEVVVCDEASMVSTRDLARLVTLTHAAGGKAVLVGDHRQLGSVDAGGLFRLLATDAHTAELTAIRRFSDPWEGDATRRLRAGDTSVLCEYDTRGRISSGDRTAMLDAAHAAWAAARADGRTVVVMASDHDTVNQLALRARAARVAAGEVAAVGIRSGGQIVGVGDEVVTTLNDRRLVTTAGGWVRNGDCWRVQSHRPDGTVVLDSLDGGGRVTAPADYATDHLALAYAVTVHKSQGLTVDDAVLVVDTNTAAEHLYVGMTRGRHTNHAYVACEPVDTDHGGRWVPSAHDVLAGALRRTTNERSATETDRDRPDPAIVDIRALQATFEEARRRIDATAGPDRRAEIERHRRSAAGRADAARALAEAETRLARLTARRHAAGEALERAEAARRQAQQPRFLRRPDRQLLSRAADAVSAAVHQVHDADQAVRRADQALAAARRDHDCAEKALRALHEAETAQEGRQAWLRAHPEAVEHLAALARTIRHARTEASSQTSGPGGRPQEPRVRSGPGSSGKARRPAAFKELHEPARSDPWLRGEPSVQGPEL
jgi:conjugative relaxase-like TrwC/TraI family protein